MKLMMRMILALLIVPASFAYGSGDKGAMVAAGQGAGAVSKKYPLLSKLEFYQEWLHARTKEEKINLIMDPEFDEDPQYPHTIKDQKAILDELGLFLEENKKLLSQEQYDIVIGHLQSDRKRLDEEQKKHAARHQMPEDFEKALQDGNAKLVFAHLNQNPKDITALDEEGNNPLMDALAQEKWNVPMIELLIKMTKALNFKNDGEETALHLAALSDNPEAPRIIKLLVSAGAAPDALDKFGSMPIAYAIRNGNIQNTKALLVYKIPLEKVTNPDHPVIIDAIRSLPSGKKEVCPSCKEIHHEPTAKEQIELLELLAQHGADMNATSTDGETPLTSAVVNNNEPVVRYLLNHKVKTVPRAIDSAVFGYSNLEEKDKKQRLSIIKLLLEHGANPEGSNPEWPLSMHVAWNGDLPVMKLLVEHGAHVHNQYLNQTPLDYARTALNSKYVPKEEKKKLKDTIEYLEKISPAHKESQGAKEAQAAKESNPKGVSRDVLALVSEFAAGPTHPDKITLNTIKKALMGDHKGQMGNYDPEFNKIVNADISVLEVQDEAGDTPLLLAIKYNKPDAVATILTVVESMPDETAQQKLLRAILSHENEQKFNAYRLAQELGHKYIVEMLAKYEK